LTAPQLGNVNILLPDTEWWTNTFLPALSDQFITLTSCGMFSFEIVNPISRVRVEDEVGIDMQGAKVIYEPLSNESGQT
jgi:hypothetical protein